MDSLIRKAILDDDVNKLEKYFKERKNDFYIIENNRNYCEYAILISSKKCSKFLIKVLDINKVENESCSSPWYNAAYTCQLDMLKRLIKKNEFDGANTHNYKTGRTPLFSLFFHNNTTNLLFADFYTLELTLKSPLIKSYFLPCEILTPTKKVSVVSEQFITYLISKHSFILEQPELLNLLLKGGLDPNVTIHSGLPKELEEPEPKINNRFPLLFVLAKKVSKLQKVPFESFKLLIDYKSEECYYKGVHYMDLIKDNLKEEWQYSLLSQLEQQQYSSLIQNTTHKRKRL